MDPLSDVLRAVKLNGAYFYLVEAAAPWSVSARAARELVPRILPDTQHLISYHILMSGTCWAGVEGEPQVRMEAGDVIVFPQGDAHMISSADGHRLPTERDDAAPDRHPTTVIIGTGAGLRATFESRAGCIGSETMLTRMAELMFIEVVRRHVEQLSPQQTGWLAGLRDAVVGPALSELHGRPAHP